MDKESTTKEQTPTTQSRWEYFKSEWGGFTLLLLALFTFRSVIADWNAVPTGSMKPTIYEGDRIWVNKLAYGLRIPFTDIRVKTLGEPERGDIVVFPEVISGKRYIKRVVGVAGDEIQVVGNLIYLNGERLKYTPYTQQQLLTVEDIPGSDRYTSGKKDEFIYLEESLKEGKKHSIRISNPDYFRPLRTANFGPVTVPQGHFMFMGDNRDESADSRYLQYTFVPTDSLIGKATRVAWSHNYANYYLPRKNRFFKPIDELSK